MVLTVSGAAVTVGVVLLSWRSQDASLTSKAVLIDTAIIALGGVFIAAVAGQSSNRWIPWTPWVVFGALCGAAAISIVSVAMWLYLAALLFAAAGVVTGWPTLTSGLIVAFVVAVLNLALLWSPQWGGYSPTPTDQFVTEGLRAHDFVRDMPIHDAWMVRLRGGGENRSLTDVHEVLGNRAVSKSIPVVLALAGLREVLGHLLHWDDERADGQALSHMTRLTEADRVQSLLEPGYRSGSFQCIYVFHREALFEIINRTVHALIVVKLVPAEEGYDLHLGIFVEPVNWFTPFYMALIDPFRRLFVYPAIIKRVEHDWAARWEL